MKHFNFSVRTPDAEILKTAVNSVKISTEEMGPMVVYRGHASLTGSVRMSRLFVRTDSGEHEYLVRNGVLFVSFESNSTKLLCYSCQEMKDIEYRTAKEYLEYIEQKLKAGANLGDIQLRFLKNEKIAMVEQMREIHPEE